MADIHTNDHRSGPCDRCGYWVHPQTATPTPQRSPTRLTHHACPVSPPVQDLRTYLPGALPPGVTARVHWLSGHPHPTWEAHPHPGYCTHDRHDEAPRVCSAVVVAAGPHPHNTDPAGPGTYTLVRAATDIEARDLRHDEDTTALLYTLAAHLQNHVADRPATTPSPHAYPEDRHHIRGLLGIYVPLSTDRPTSDPVEYLHPHTAPRPTSLIIYPDRQRHRIWFDTPEQPHTLHRYPDEPPLSDLVDALLPLCWYAPSSHHFSRVDVAALWPCEPDSVRGVLAQQGVTAAYRGPGSGQSFYRADQVLNAKMTKTLRGRGSWRNRPRPTPTDLQATP